MPNFPLTASAAAIRSDVLKVPITYDAIRDEQPAAISDDEVERIHAMVTSGNNAAIPRLERLIKQFPEWPTLKNYLKNAYEMQGRNRQARQVHQEILKCHPDYLFGKIESARVAIKEKKLELAREILGKDLDLQKLYPDREIFHITELKNYYYVVAFLYLEENKNQKAIGLHAALGELLSEDDEMVENLRDLIRVGNLISVKKRMIEEEETKITVTTQPLPESSVYTETPTFHHPEILELYQNNLTIPEKTIQNILSLPRETLSKDLIHVLEDAIARTAHFLDIEGNDSDSYFAIHAIHLLGELSVEEALPTILHFLSQNEEALEFWLGDFIYGNSLASLLKNQLPLVKDWLKSPGLPELGKSHIVNGLEHLAEQQPDHRDKVIAVYQECLEFYLTCSREDNVIDTYHICGMISDVVNLRAVALQPLIEQLHAKNYYSQAYFGELEDLLADLHSPQKDNSHGRKSIAEHYRKLNHMIAPVQESLPSGHNPFENNIDFGMSPDRSHQAAPPSRNDPCRCGSGKKYKKCCLK
jgi:Protein of unknown function (DUF1186)/SEC-C motif